MPKIKTLTKAESKRRKKEAARNYYRNNRDAVNERNRLAMQRSRSRAQKTALAAAESAIMEKEDQVKRQLAAQYGTRMLAQWRDSVSSDGVDSPHFSEMDASPSPDRPEAEHDEDQADNSDSIAGESDDFETLTRKGYIFYHGRWHHVDDDDSEGSGDQEDQTKEDWANHQGYHRAQTFTGPGSIGVSHHFPRTTTIPTSSIRENRTPITRPSTRFEDLPPSSPPSSSDDEVNTAPKITRDPELEEEYEEWELPSPPSFDEEMLEEYSTD